MNRTRDLSLKKVKIMKLFFIFALTLFLLAGCKKNTLDSSVADELLKWNTDTINCTGQVDQLREEIISTTNQSSSLQLDEQNKLAHELTSKWRESVHSCNSKYKAYQQFVEDNKEELKKIKTVDYYEFVVALDDAIQSFTEEEESINGLIESIGEFQEIKEGDEMDKPFIKCSDDPTCGIKMLTKSMRNMSSQELKETIVWVDYEVEWKDDTGESYSGEITGSGVIFQQDPRRLLIFTNRHVIDCTILEEDCYQRVQESITVRTNDGKIHPVTRILFEPHNLDIAVLEVNASNAYLYKAATPEKESHWGDVVIAIGYPTAELEGGYVELLMGYGTVQGKKEVLNRDGFSFEVLESDAYGASGSSGGGLFSSDTKKLIGITTWADRYGFETDAISIKSVGDISNYRYCPEGRYFQGEECITYV